MGRVLCYALAVCFWATGAMAHPDPRDAAREAVRVFDLQTEIPGEVTTIQADESEGGLPPQEDDDSGWSFRIPEEVVRALLWASVVLGSAVIAWSLRDYLPGIDRSRALVAGDEDMAMGGIPTKLEAVQIEADVLAGKGQFVEAMHLLLLQSLAELRKRLDMKIADSLTSREILRMSPLSDAASAALASIIREVERTYFGQQPAATADYASCRQHFAELKLFLNEGVA